MPTTRPGYIWSGTEWVAIGQEAVVAPVKYQTSAPTSPATGDIWIDSDDDVPGIDTSQFLRWRKTMAGGETSLSGTDDNGLTLKYTPNYEQLYINGVLQVRAQDYTATNGTSITGLTALAANDVVEVFGVVARTVGDVYTQAQTNSLLDTKSNVSSTGLVLLNTQTVSASAGVSFTNIFDSNYTFYRVVFGAIGSTALEVYVRARMNTTDYTTNDYLSVNYRIASNGGTSSQGNSASTVFLVCAIPSSGERTLASMDFYPDGTKLTYNGLISDTFNNTITMAAGNVTASSNVTGFTIYPSTGTFTGTIKVYGYK